MGADAGARNVLARAWRDLARDPSELDAVGELPTAPLRAHLDVSALAVGAVASASLAAAIASGRGGDALALDGERIAAAFGSDRAFARGGRGFPSFAPLSGFWRTADGWIRTHGNYPWHAVALRRVAGLASDAGAEAFASAVAGRGAVELSREVTDAGGLCVPVAREDPADTASRIRTPLLERTPIPGGGRDRRTARRGPRPLDGIRILDLTRVIAGPVATRTLAQLGAEVLRLDPPHRPEIPAQHLDTGAGKRSARLDLVADRARFLELLDRADAVVLGYRPAALEHLGLAPEELAARRPGLVVARLSAWGFTGPEADRRGFDSIVQATSGISWIESADGCRPGALPVQALDHATGSLLAAAVIGELDRAEDGSTLIRASLRRTATELLAGRRTAAPSGGALDDAGHLAHTIEFATPLGTVRTTRPALRVRGIADDWPAPPRPWGTDLAAW